MPAGVTRRRALVMADQGIASLSNVVVSIVAARSLSADGFGAFSVATVGYFITSGLGRALVGETFLSTYSAGSARQRRAVMSDMVAAAVVVSLVAAGVVAVVGALVGGAAGAALLALALVLPLLLAQDAWRYAFIVDRPGRAVVVDLAWLLAIAVVMPLAPEGASPSWFVVAWGLGAGIGAVAGYALTSNVLRIPRPRHWLVTHRAMSSRFLGELVTGQVITQLVLIGVGAIAGLSALGGVRAAQVYYGPLNTVHQGIYLALVPEGAKVADPRRHRRLMLRASLLLIGVSAVWTAVGLAVPDAWGEKFFSDTWAEAGALMLPVGLATMAASAQAGGFAGVRSVGDAAASLRARLWTIGPLIALPLAGAAIGSGVGYATGLTLANLVAAWIWWSAFGGAIRRRDRAEPSDAQQLGVVEPIADVAIGAVP